MSHPDRVRTHYDDTPPVPSTITKRLQYLEEWRAEQREAMDKLVRNLERLLERSNMEML